MFDRKGNELISKFKTLTDFIEEMAATGDENAALILDELNSFGCILVEYVLECSNEISKLKNRNLDLEESVKELNEKLEILEKAVPKTDYEFYFVLAKNKYKKFWHLMEENSKKFIATSMYVFNLLKAYSSDFSPVIIEITKALETEMKNKLFLNFIISQSKKPVLHNEGAFTQSINRYKENQSFFLPFTMFFHSLRPVSNTPTNSCYYALHQTLKTDGWDVSILTSSDFRKDGIDLSENYRNLAAHSNTLTMEDAVACSKKTKKLIFLFLSAYPKKNKQIAPIDF